MDCGTVEKTQLKSILYTGNLGRRYGILTLLDAFLSIKSSDYRLWIRGAGDTLNDIRERQKEDPRIVIYDPLSREDLVRLEKSATLLVNPVSSKEEFTSFFFPSKTMEYLASGTPTLMCRLACLPNEYHQHLFFFKDDSVEDLRDKIEQICSKPQAELEEFGAKASEFILNKKTPKVQVKHIIDFLNKL